ncbi:MAG: DUF4234 domain-containing protein [Gaiellaceae bacterium]
MSETPEDPTTTGSAEPAAQPHPVIQPPLPATSAPAQGPAGKPRSILFVIVLSIVTLGIYHLYWYYKTFEEMKRHTGNGIGGILGLLIAIVFNPVNWFVLPSEIGSMYRGDGRPAPMTGWTGLWILLPLVGWFVWTVKTQGALNRYWDLRPGVSSSSASPDPAPESPVVP